MMLITETAPRVKPVAPVCHIPFLVIDRLDSFLPSKLPRAHALKPLLWSNQFATFVSLILLNFFVEPAGEIYLFEHPSLPRTHDDSLFSLRESYFIGGLACVMLDPALHPPLSRRLSRELHYNN